MATVLTTLPQGSKACSPILVNNDGEETLYIASASAGDVSSVTLSEEGPTEPRIWAATGGMPGGIAIDEGALPKGSTVYAADMVHGVVSLGNDGSKQVVVAEYEKKKLMGANSICFDSKGSIFFTDSGPLGESTLEKPRGSVFVVDGGERGQMLRPLAYECLAHPSGIAVSANSKHLYVCETLRNRLLRFVQRPAGVWHYSVFKQFAGGLGPFAVACGEDGSVVVARGDLDGSDGRGVLTVLSSATGEVTKEIPMPSSELSGVALSKNGKKAIVTESATNQVFEVAL